MNPKAVEQWNTASPDWHCPRAENEPKEGGRFCYTMAAKDGSFSFDFTGTYTAVEPYSLIAFTMDDDRRAEMRFEAKDGGTLVVEKFEAEGTNPEEMQREGWQSILNNYRDYCDRQV